MPTRSHNSFLDTLLTMAFGLPLAGTDPVRQTRSLLSHVLVRRVGETEFRLPITEVELYCGEDDLACHARVGRTERTKVMYGPAGYWYVYLVYGMHHMLNLVIGDEGHPAAVLIRSAGNVQGPGRLTKALEIDRSLNGREAMPDSGLWIEVGKKPDPESIIATPRIGIDYAGPEWSAKPWRFVLAQD